MLRDDDDAATTFSCLLRRSDDSFVLLTQLGPTDVMAIACTSHEGYKAVIEYVRDTDGFARLWRVAWPDALVIRRKTQELDWHRCVVHTSWLVPTIVSTAAHHVDEHLVLDIQPPATVGTVGTRGVVQAWRVSATWHKTQPSSSSCPSSDASMLAQAESLVDARGDPMGVSHSSRIPRAHRLSKSTLCQTPNVNAPGHLAQLIHALGWLTPFGHPLGRMMIETRSDGSIYLKVISPSPSPTTLRFVRRSWPASEARRGTCHTSSVRLLPSNDLRAAFWLYARSCAPIEGKRRIIDTPEVPRDRPETPHESPALLASSSSSIVTP